MSYSLIHISGLACETRHKRSYKQFITVNFRFAGVLVLDNLLVAFKLCPTTGWSKACKGYQTI